MTAVCHLINTIVDIQTDPWRSYHVERITALLIAPVSSDLAELETHEVVIVVHKCVHICVQALGCVHVGSIELHFNEIIRVRYK